MRFLSTHYSQWPMRWGPSAEQVVERWQSFSQQLTVAEASSRVWSVGEGEPVICVHGVPASAYVYRKVLPALARQGLQGIAFDLPGLGLAERPVDFDYSWGNLSTWLGRAIDALGVDSFHLLIHDIGGPITLNMLKNMPERVKSLTVLNTIIRVSQFERPWSMQPFALKGFGRCYVSIATPVVLAQFMRIQGVASNVPSAELEAYSLLLKNKDNGAAFLRIMRGFERTKVFEQGIVEALKARKFPAQLLWSDADPALPREHYAPIAQVALGLKSYQVLPGKHFLQEDSPEEIAQAIANLAKGGC